jgi:hypothetical protein
MGQFRIQSTGTTHVIIDVFGYTSGQSANAGYWQPVSPGRIYDSRDASGNQGQGLGKLRKGGADNTNVRIIEVTNRFPSNVPSSAKAAIVNLTAAQTEYGGYFTLYPAHLPAPSTSSVNWNITNIAGSNIPSDVPNLAIVPLGVGGTNAGKLNITVGGNHPDAGAHILVDVVGFIDSFDYPTTSGHYFSLLNPRRITEGTIPANTAVSVQITGSGTGVPRGVQAAVLHLTAQNVTGGGFMSMYEGGVSSGGISNVNTNNANQAPGNLSIVPLNQNGVIEIYNGNAQKGFRLDVVGYITEIDYPGCRWPHTTGSTTNVTYKWQSGDPFVNPDQPWRTALFAALETDWTGSNSSRLRFWEVSGGSVTVGTYNMDDGRSGVAYQNCNASNQITNGFTVQVNHFNEPGNQDHRIRVSNHEVGHAHSLGHISYRKGYAIMGDNPNGFIIRPNLVDFELDRRIYP